jgi:hypothetical protein
VAAATSTTIRGVSVLSGRQRGHVFDIALSRDGIGVRHPERPVQFMSWDRVSEWELDDREGYVLLTLRGQGATTPLVIPDWTFDDLANLMRDVTADYAMPETEAEAQAETDESEPIANDASGAAGTTGATATETAEAIPAPAEPEPDPVAQDPAPEAGTSNAAAAADAHEAPVGTRPSRRARHQARQRRPSWKIPVTVVLLGLLAAAVIAVLLQSAGVIDWSFLGPVA